MYGFICFPPHPLHFHLFFCTVLLSCLKRACFLFRLLTLMLETSDDLFTTVSSEIIYCYLTFAVQGDL